MTVDAFESVGSSIAQRWMLAQNRKAPISSNVGASELPYQRWFRFKEAYSPAFVLETIESCDYDVRHVIDPFGGSGTTALTAKMYGLDSTSVEVNPFMADLIRAKVGQVFPSSFKNSCQRLCDRTKIEEEDYDFIDGAPRTLTEPGVNGRFIFSREAYAAIRSLVRRSRLLEASESRLARVLIGSILVDCSNVLINGKGRRYRRNWERNKFTKNDVFDRFEVAVSKALEDLENFQSELPSRHVVHTGDARICLSEVEAADLAIFSPPYPNSFDYTDVYNLELWMLGYLRSSSDNRRLRESTLRSHVQIKWPEFSEACKSSSLKEVYKSLDEYRNKLWNRNIPEMVMGYFSDLELILRSLRNIIPVGHHVVAAVGDSQYAGVKIDVAAILSEIALSQGYEVESACAIRSMRTSAQHGGSLELSETALRFRVRGS